MIVLKIKEISQTLSGCNPGATHKFIFENRDFSPFEVTSEFMEKHSPVAGGYFLADNKIGYSQHAP